MRMMELDELKTHKDVKHYFDWMPGWTEESLLNCFKFLSVELEPYEFFFSDNSACVLIKGEGTVNGRKVSAPVSFGIDTSGEKVELVSDMFKATEDSILICFNKNIFNNICVGIGCGSMHTRFREMIKELNP